MSKNPSEQQFPTAKRARVSAPFHPPRPLQPPGAPMAPLLHYVPSLNPIDSRTATAQTANSFSPFSVGATPLLPQPSPRPVRAPGLRSPSMGRPSPLPSPLPSASSSSMPYPRMPAHSSFGSPPPLASSSSAMPHSAAAASFPFTSGQGNFGGSSPVVNVWQDQLPPYNPATGSNLATPNMMATHPYNAQVFNKLLTGRTALGGTRDLGQWGVVATPSSFKNNFGASRTFDLPSAASRLSPITHVGNHGFSDYRYNYDPRGTLGHSERVMGADLLDRLMQQNPGHFPPDEITRPWALTRTPRGDRNRDALSVLASPAQANQYRGALEKAGVGINMGSERAFCPECQPWYENLAPKGSKGFHIIDPHIYKDLNLEGVAKKIESRIPDIQQNWFSLIRGMSNDWNIGDLTNSLAHVPNNLPSIGSPVGAAAGIPAAASSSSSSSSSSYNP